jgi:hypothetical protein
MFSALELSLHKMKQFPPTYVALLTWIFLPSANRFSTSTQKFVDQYGGPESDFFEENGFYIDYVIGDLLRCTTPGWQQRVTIIELAPGLRGHFLDAHDIAYNKLWAGRPKNIVWVRGLLETGIIRLARLIELHEVNPIAEEDLAKVRRSLDQVVLRPQ